MSLSGVFFFIVLGRGLRGRNASTSGRYLGVGRCARPGGPGTCRTSFQHFYSARRGSLSALETGAQGSRGTEEARRARYQIIGAIWDARGCDVCTAGAPGVSAGALGWAGPRDSWA
ncbi:hypothetical protein NDU88_001870 [Pleurodeles waltl]|uniref:Secreted protein n=1 Tax=Pleurodeles waltl TaxID=8319 RepID=A0AAV7UX63_PLEWA|nr:hypothetical protein NDU88_001870 [Pleurodeles waltl]